MALSDIFTGNSITNAAQQQRQYLSGLGDLTSQTISGNLGQGLGAISSGVTGAQGAIGGGVNAATGAVDASVPQAIGAIQGGTAAGASAVTGSLDPAVAALMGGVGTAEGAYQPVSDISQQYAGYTGQTSQAQADALGLNGPEGTARSRASFTASPGYQFSTEQGLQGVVRGANAAGMAPGGNTLAAAGEYVTNAANKEWDNYLAQLQARQGLYAPLALSGAGTAAGGIANAALAGGTGTANAYLSTGSKLADLYSSGGANQAGVYTGAGKTLSDILYGGGIASGNAALTGGQAQANLLGQATGQQVGFNQSVAPQVGQTYGAEGIAPIIGATNLFNLAIQGGKAAAATPAGTFASLLPAPGGSSYGPYPRMGG